MWLERTTLNPKPGRRDDLLALLREAREQFPGPHGGRILRCGFGPVGAVAREIQWESWDEHIRVWKRWLAKPEFSAFAKRLSKLIEAGGTREVWSIEG